MTPSMVWPCRSAARYAKVGMPASVFLSDAQDLLDRGLTRLRLGPAGLAERGHAEGHRVAARCPAGAVGQPSSRGEAVPKSIACRRISLVVAFRRMRLRISSLIRKSS